MYEIAMGSSEAEPRYALALYYTCTKQIPNIFNRNLSDEEWTLKPSASAKSDGEYADSNADFPRSEKRIMGNQKIDALGRLIKPMKNNEKPGIVGAVMNWIKEIFKPKTGRQNVRGTLCTHGPYGCFR